VSLCAVDLRLGGLDGLTLRRLVFRQLLRAELDHELVDLERAALFAELGED
jgi:hypothetical protein